VLGNLISIRACQQVCGPYSSLSPTHLRKKLKHNELDQEWTGRLDLHLKCCCLFTLGGFGLPLAQFPRMLERYTGIQDGAKE
jgi:hypothetical protein